MSDPNLTQSLLQRWHGGDQSALSELISKNLDWIRSYVGQRLGAKLRDKFETQDMVQEVMVDVLKYGPKFVMSDQQKFRSLMAQIIENNLRDKNDWMKARKRAADREKPLPPGSMIDLDLPLDAVTRPSQAMDRNQNAAWLRLAMELLEPDDRQLIHLRQWEKQSFDQVGETLGIKANAARMRFQRALARLAAKLQELRNGDVG